MKNDSSTFLSWLTRLYLTIPLLAGVVFPVIFLTSKNGRENFLHFYQGAGLAVPILFTVVWVGLALLARQAWRDNHRAQAWGEQAAHLLANPLLYWGLVTLAGLGTFAGLLLLPLSNQVCQAPAGEVCFIQWLSPFVAWGTLLSIQTLIAVRLALYGRQFHGFEDARGVWRALVVVLAVLIGLVLFIRVSGIGLTPDTVDWGVPNVPILAAQVLLAISLTFAVFAAGKLVIWMWQKRSIKSTLNMPPWAVDVLIFVLLWVSAFGIWSRQPLQPSWFNPEPRAPNQEYYPYSDSIHYDLSAQRLLLGQGFEAEVIRPVYSAFLALAQAVSGIGYQSVVLWQTVVLALIPGLLYLLGKSFHHRISGLFVALLAILHESNALALTGLIDVSNSKMYLSELPTQLGILIFCLLIVEWFKAPEDKKLYPLLAGGTLGIFMLVRTQIVLIGPVLPVLAWLAYRKQPRLWVQASALLVVGIALSLAPWTVRNWITTRSVLSDPEPGGVIFRYESFAPQAQQPLPGESPDAHWQRLRQTIIANMLAQPDKSLGVVAGHYTNNFIATLFVMPTAFPQPHLTGSAYSPCSGMFWQTFRTQCCSVKDYVTNQPYWSGTWDMRLPPQAWLPLISNLVLISLGLAVSWDRRRWASLAPLLITAFYNIGNAGARLSGWRFSQPVDWIGILFYAIALVQLTFWLATLFSNRLVPQPAQSAEANAHIAPDPVRSTGNVRRSIPAALGVSLFFLIFTTMLPIAEHAIPNRYANQTVEAVLDQLEKDGLLAKADLDRATVERMLQEPDAVAYVGRALYPRQYWANQGEISKRWPVYLTRDYARLGFLMAPQKAQVVLQFQKRPKNFPNAADVFVLGCQRDNYVQAYYVALLSEDGVALPGTGFEQWTCATP